MFVVVGVVFLWLRPRETLRLWPALLPALVVIHLALPGTLGSLKNSFMPPGGLVAEQKSDAGQSGSGRLADLGPGLQRMEAAAPLRTGLRHPRRRIPRRRAPAPRATNILDDQWLGTLLETGAVGFFGWLWFFARVVRRFGGRPRETIRREDGC